MGDMKNQWPIGEAWDERNCHSAPPVAMCSPEPNRMRRTSSKRFSKSSKCVVEDEAEDSEAGRMLEGPSTSGNQFRTSPFLSTDNERENQVASSDASQQLIANFIPKSGDQLHTNNHQSFTLNVGGLMPVSAGVEHAASIDLNLLKITQPQLAALIASALLAKSESESAQVEQQSGFIAATFAAPTAGMDKPPTVVHPPIQPSTSINMGNFLALEEYPCSMCGKKFRKSQRNMLHCLAMILHF